MLGRAPRAGLIVSHIAAGQKGEKITHINRLLWLTVFAVLLVYLGFTAWLALSGLAYPYQLDYGEGAMLEQANLISQGRSIYKGMEGYPYAFSNYPPLVQALTALLIPVLGVTYTAGRIWNVLALFGLAALAFHVVRRLGGGRTAALLAALCFAGSPYIYHWAPLYRVDLPGLAFAALGVAVVAAAGRSVPRRWASYLAALLFVAALYSKHSYLAAPAAAFLYLMIQRRGDALRLLAASIALGGGLFLAIDWATAGAFRFALITTNANPFSLQDLLAQIGDFARTHAVLVALAALGAVVRWRDAWTGGGFLAALGRLSVWDIYFAAGAATVLLAGKVGSWENYFFEPLFVVCIYAGLGAGHLLRRSVAWQTGLAAALLLQAGLMFHTPEIAARLMAEDGPANQRMAQIIAATPGAIVSEDMGLLVTSGRQIPFFGFEYTQLARMGLWDQSWEQGMLRRAEFPLVILEAGTRENPDRYHRFTRQFLSELDRSYALSDSVGKYRLYRPSPLRELDPAPTFGPADAPLVALDGYRLDPPALEPGKPLAVSILWRALRPMDQSYTVFVHLLDAAGGKAAQHDGLPFAGIYPTDRWAAGELVRDVHTLQLPPSLPPGKYRLVAGLYLLATGQRLDGPGGGVATLAEFIVP